MSMTSLGAVLSVEPSPLSIAHPHVTVSRLLRVRGVKRAHNDLLHAVAEPRPTAERDGGTAGAAGKVPAHVVVFPGDAQHWHEAMSRGNVAKYQEYSLDATGVLLAQKLPGCHVWVVKASRFHEGLYACYDHFLHTSDVFGRPDGGGATSVRGLPHLGLLLQGALAATPDAPPLDAPGGVALVGFSKGSIVLDQLLSELALIRAIPPMAGADAARALRAAVQQVHWVDGMGHPDLFATPVTSLLSPASSARVAAAAAREGVDTFSATTVMPGRGRGAPLRGSGDCLPPSVASAAGAGAGSGGRGGPPAASPFSVLLPVGADAGAAASPDLPPFRSVAGVSVADLPTLFGHGDMLVGVHGTPYQWRPTDVTKASRRRASELFVAAVRAAGCTAFLRQYFSDSDAGEAGAADGPKDEPQPPPPDGVLRYHFAVLRELDLGP